MTPSGARNLAIALAAIPVQAPRLVLSPPSRATKASPSR